MIHLVEPHQDYSETIQNYKDAYFEYNPDTLVNGIQGSAYLVGYDHISEWIQACYNQKHSNKLAAGRVNASTFLTIDSDTDEMVGIVNIRHQLNDYLKQVGGHIGYSVKPDHFRRGIGKAQLKLALAYCKDDLNLNRVLITCDDDNQPSAATIKSLGGQLEDTIEFEGEMVRRYWITLY